jgi:hypothetical protein
MRVSRYTVIGVARDIIEEEVYDDTYSDATGFVGDDNYDYGIDF